MAGIILVYDVTSPVRSIVSLLASLTRVVFGCAQDSFDHVDVWLQEVDRNAKVCRAAPKPWHTQLVPPSLSQPGVPKLLIGTKADMEAKVPTEQAQV
jgi:hypothetical protein